MLLLIENRVIRINKIVLPSGSSLFNKKLTHIQVSVVEDYGLHTYRDVCRGKDKVSSA